MLHNRSVEMAKKYGVPLVVRSSLNNSEGTVVKEEVTVERMLISGVALDTDAVRIAVIGLKMSRVWLLNYLIPLRRRILM